MFKDRQHAGRALAKRLHFIDPALSVVLALPRGGVPVAKEICDATGTPLDLMLVLKVGVPAHIELAVCAIADGPGSSLVVNQEVAKAFGLGEEEVRKLAKPVEVELERRRRLYLGSRSGIALGGKTVILVDDGVATGATMRSAVKAARARGADRIVVAVPVASREAIKLLEGEGDQVICLVTPKSFKAVGEHYASFPQVSDAEMTAALSTQA